MRLNKWLVQMGAAGARRKADDLIADQRVRINGALASLGDIVEPNDTITVDGTFIEPMTPTPRLIALNKPAGYVSSHARQGSAETIFSLLPPDFRDFKIVGRLDKDSQGLMLLTNSGELANQLTHPSHNVAREYVVELSATLTENQIHTLIADGIEIDGELRKFSSLSSLGGTRYQIVLYEGRNRQIRRSFEPFGFEVTELTRTKHDRWSLGELTSGHWREEVID